MIIQVTSISITASSQLQILSAYSCALENAELLGTKLRKLDVHDNQLGGGKLYVGNIKYENHSLASGSYDWQDNGVLEYICAYDNDIYHAMSIPRDTHGKVTYTFRLGCDIPDSVAVGWRDFKVTSEGYKGGGTHYHIGSYSNNGYSGGKHGPGNSRRTYYNNGTVLKSQITQQAGDMLEAQAYWRSGDWYSNSGSARFYPFGQ